MRILFLGIDLYLSDSYLQYILCTDPVLGWHPAAENPIYTRLRSDFGIILGRQSFLRLAGVKGG